MQGLHDIRPPVMVGMDPFWIRAAWIAGAICLLGLVLWILLKKIWKKKQNSQEKLSLGQPLHDPLVSAMEALDDLEKNVSPGTDAKNLYFALGDIMKTYIGKTYNTGAREMTTQELAAGLKSVSMERRLAAQVIRFQEECDPFRYAPEHTDMSHEIAKDISQARSLIQAMEKDRFSRLAATRPIEDETPMPVPLPLPGETL